MVSNLTMVVALLKGMRFPELDESGLDAIVHNCWQGKYNSVKDLKHEVLHLSHNIRLSLARAITREEYEARPQECLQLLIQDVLSDAPQDE